MQSYGKIGEQLNTVINLSNKKKETIIYNKTGLLIDAYFSATKIKWIIDNVPKAKQLIKQKRLLFGTVDCFLLLEINGRNQSFHRCNKC